MRRTSKNFVNYHAERELDEKHGKVLERKFKVTDGFITRLGLYGELEGHNGCVNCLEWNSDGSLLASGSDDVCVNIYRPLIKKLVVSIPSGHQGNIFSVKFVPCSGDRIVISAAADHLVRVHDVPSKENLSICSCHSGRVKRLATDATSPNLYWSAGEDGLIIQHDFRESHTCASDSNKSNVLIDLKSYIGPKAEAKCLTVNPVRPEIIGVGANDPFVRLYDRRMIKLSNIEEPGADSYEIGCGAVQYFVPGHLPTKLKDYKRKYRSLASTYVAFNSEGTELLVNLGGEQIYLFPLNSHLQNTNKKFSFPESEPNLLADQASKHSDKTASNGYKNGLMAEMDKENDCFAGKYTDKRPLPKHIETIKIQANAAFEGKKYVLAVHLYNEAISRYSESAVLFGNRGAALLKRAWDGDIYESLKDCYFAINIDPQHFKAHLRISRCLYELGRFDESLTSLNQFKARFPKFVSTEAYKSLEKDLLKAQKKLSSSSQTSPSSSSNRTNSTSSVSSSSDQPVTAGSSSTASSPRSNESSRDRNFFLRFTSTFSSDNSNSDRSSQDDSDVAFVNELAFGNLDQPEGNADDRNSSQESTRNKKVPKFQEKESEFQEKAFDYTERYCGHCNTTTDIKEANFFGDYIVAGSDDGSFFIWHRETTNIVKIVRGDESIVNCLQPHPSTCVLATSGIESVIRLWAPMNEEETLSDRVVEDWDSAATENQKRMKSNPFEMILMNMGYRLNNSGDNEAEEAELDGPSLRCNQT